MTPLLQEMLAERDRQAGRFPAQRLPLGTGREHWHRLATHMKDAIRRSVEDGTLTWADVLREEMYEVLAETDPQRIRKELIQLAAVALRVVEDIDQGD